MARTYRGVDFVDREKEIEYFIDYFQKKPERILWVYGPKSTGKTTLIEYIIENELDTKEYNIKYLNFRRTLVSRFDNFIESFLEEKDEESQTELNRNYNLFGLFKLEAKTLKKIKENRKNIFNYLLEEFNKEKRKNIFIIDEIQSLEDIYINGDKKLLSEFLNFCVALTKETHLSHVLILTSNTIFLNEIYNNAKMKVTSDFKLIDHLPTQEIEDWLTSKDIGFSLEDAKLICDYLGGSAAHIKKVIDFKDQYSSLKEQLEEMVQMAMNEIIFLKNNHLLSSEYEIFKDIMANILKDGYYIFDEDDDDKKEITKKSITKLTEVEILFYDPLKNIIIANSRIYEKAFERIVGKKLKAGVKE